MTKSKKCIGFGDKENRCKEPVAKDSTYWCMVCEKARINHINKQFGALKEDMERESEILHKALRGQTNDI